MSVPGQPPPTVSAPLVWVELITSDLARASAFYGAAVSWKAFGDHAPTGASRAFASMSTTVYLDHARAAGPICGIRLRSPADPLPPGAVPGGPVPDRWGVRLAPPRPDAAVDPQGDQLLRPRAPGPRLGRWAAPNSLCFAELRTGDVAAAAAWIERRLDAVVEPLGDGRDGVLVRSSVDRTTPVFHVLHEDDPAWLGWAPFVQVGSIEPAISAAEGHGATVLAGLGERTGWRGQRSAILRDSGGALIGMIEDGPTQGRRG